MKSDLDRFNTYLDLPKNIFVLEDRWDDLENRRVSI